MQNKLLSTIIGVLCLGLVMSSSINAQAIVFFGEVPMGQNKTFYPNYSVQNSGKFQQHYSAQVNIVEGVVTSGTVEVNYYFSYEATVAIDGVGSVDSWFEITIAPSHDPYVNYHANAITHTHGTKKDEKKGEQNIILRKTVNKMTLFNVVFEIGGDRNIFQGTYTNHAQAILSKIEVRWVPPYSIGDILYRPGISVSNDNSEPTKDERFFGHVGIYIGEGLVIEALKGNIQRVERREVKVWEDEGNFYVLRVNCANSIRERAVNFACSQYGRPYRLYLGRNPDGNIPSRTWYCSELVWAAYYNNGINLMPGEGNNEYEPYKAISPGDIDRDDDTFRP